MGSISEGSSGEGIDALSTLACWFCLAPAVTIGYSFAVCGGRPDGEMNCSERARDLFRRTVTEAAR